MSNRFVGIIGLLLAMQIGSLGVFLLPTEAELNVFGIESIVIMFAIVGFFTYFEGKSK